VKKVYCRNCKWYFVGGYMRTHIQCWNPENCIDSYKAPKDRLLNTPMEINKENECPYYKRKWYKFWVK